MRMPILCPICKENMIRTVIDEGPAKKYLAVRSLSIHPFLTYYSSYENFDEVRYFIYFDKFTPPNLSIAWHPNDNIIRIFKSGKMISIPYFEPDFSKQEEMLNKINIYLKFA